MTACSKVEKRPWIRTSHFDSTRFHLPPCAGSAELLLLMQRPTHQASSGRRAPRSSAAMGEEKGKGDCPPVSVRCTPIQNPPPSWPPIRAAGAANLLARALAPGIRQQRTAARHPPPCYAASPLSAPLCSLHPSLDHAVTSRLLASPPGGRR